MTETSVEHATFTIERDYPFSAAELYRAHVDPAHKRKWFVEGEGWQVFGYEHDIRTGGFERSSFSFKGGPRISNNTVHLDLVENRRIVSAYTMALESITFSASLATLEFLPAAKGAKLVYTEQGAYFGGGDQAHQREEGCRQLFGILHDYLAGRQKVR
ncbi:MAG: SRPBCC family protein [Rhizobiaceae bacterium]|nr:SRPBCC family protein [Rhizobiaceae bacterium]